MDDTKKQTILDGLIKKFTNLNKSVAEVQATEERVVTSADTTIVEPPVSEEPVHEQVQSVSEEQFETFRNDVNNIIASQNEMIQELKNKLQEATSSPIIPNVQTSGGEKADVMPELLKAIKG